VGGGGGGGGGDVLRIIQVEIKLKSEWFLVEGLPQDMLLKPVGNMKVGLSHFGGHYNRHARCNFLIKSLLRSEERCNEICRG